MSRLWLRETRAKRLPTQRQNLQFLQNQRAFWNCLQEKETKRERWRCQLRGRRVSKRTNRILLVYSFAHTTAVLMTIYFYRKPSSEFSSRYRRIWIINQWGICNQMWSKNFSLGPYNFMTSWRNYPTSFWIHDYRRNFTQCMHFYPCHRCLQITQKSFDFLARFDSPSCHQQKISCSNSWSSFHPITKVNKPTTWCAPGFFVPKPNGTSVRLVTTPN